MGGAFYSKPPSQALGLLLCLQAAYSIGDRVVLWLLAAQHRYHSYANPPSLSLLQALLSMSSYSQHGKAAVNALHRLPLALVAFMAPRGKSDLGVGAPQFPLGKLRQADLPPGG